MFIPYGSAPGEYDWSIDTAEESRVCLDDLEPLELALSNSPPKDLPSSLTFLFSFLVLREKKDFPPEDCLDLLSAADMIEDSQNRCFDLLYAEYGYSLDECASPQTDCYCGHLCLRFFYFVLCIFGILRRSFLGNHSSDLSRSSVGLHWINS
jgi:hypothetical protein